MKKNRSRENKGVILETRIKKAIPCSFTAGSCSRTSRLKSRFALRNLTILGNCHPKKTSQTKRWLILGYLSTAVESMMSCNLPTVCPSLCLLFFWALDLFLSINNYLEIRSLFLLISVVFLWSISVSNLHFLEFWSFSLFHLSMFIFHFFS